MTDTLSFWLSHIEEQHSQNIDMSLERVSKVYNQLAIDLSSKFIITVGGTNGKGTTSACIENLLLSCGYNVGVYSSPHMLHFNERVRVNQRDCDEREFCEAFAKIENSRANTPLTYFEYVTLAALYIFSKLPLDFVVLEVGLGGRLDATNIVDADVAVITSIGFDHEEYLGDSLAKISSEKAGIIKSKSEVVLGFDPLDVDFPHSINPNAPYVLVNKVCQLVDNTITVDFRYLDQPKQQCSYQLQNDQLPIQNAVTAIACLLVVGQKNKTFIMNILALIKDKIRVEKALNNIRLAGRFQTLCFQPMVVADVAHNPQACRYLSKQLLAKVPVKIHFIVGMMKDKNIGSCIEQLCNYNSQWYCCTLSNSRAASASLLSGYVESASGVADIKASQYSTVAKAIDAAISNVRANELICIFGSFFTLTEAINYFTGEKIPSYE